MESNKSSQVTLIVKDLIDTPNNWWVSGSIGQLTRKGMGKQLNKVNDLFIMLINHDNKKVVGPILAEMTQCHYDKDFGLLKKYESTLYKLSKDSEAVRYAEEFMNYQLESFGWYDEKYWYKAKTHLRNLAKNDIIKK